MASGTVECPNAGTKVLTVNATALAAMAITILSASAACAQPNGMMANPDFSDSVGNWDIEGVARGRGNTSVCKMQREAQNGQQFIYVAMISAGSGGLNVIDAYLTPTSLPDGSSPKVSIFFDGKKAANLGGGVQKGFVYADIAKLSATAMLRITELFKASKSLAEIVSLKGHLSEKVTVDLTDGADAFDKRGECMKAVMDIGIERMQSGHTD